MTAVLQESPFRAQSGIVLEEIMDSLPLPVFAKDSAGVYRACNEAFARFLGRSRGDILGATVADLAPPCLVGEYQARDAALLAQGGEQIYDAQVKVGSGELRQVRFHKFRLDDTAGDPRGLVGLVFDITEQQRHQRWSDVLQHSLDRAPGGLLVLNARLPGYPVLYANDAVGRLTGLPLSELLSKPFPLLPSEADDAAQRQRVLLALGRGEGFQETLPGRRGDGQMVWSDLSCSVMRDESGLVSHFLVHVSDVTWEIARADTDHAQDTLLGKLSRYVPGILFSMVRDLEGKLRFPYLSTQADPLLGDLFAQGRGADWIGALVDGADQARVRAAIEDSARQLSPWSQTFRLRDGLRHQGCLTVRAAPEPGLEGDVIWYGRGDLAPCPSVSALSRDADTAFSQAMANGQFVLRYQPRVAMRPGAVVALSVQVGWLHPRDGWLAPGTWESRLRQVTDPGAYGRWLMAQVLRQQQAWLEAGEAIARLPIGLTLPIAAWTPGMACHLAVQLARHGTPGSNLELFASGVLPSDLTVLAGEMAACRAMGVTLGLADFGLGPLSLPELGQLAPALIRLDSGLISRLAHHAADQRLLEAVLTLTEVFAITPIAPGVDDIDTARRLLRLGCTFGEGKALAPCRDASNLPLAVARWQADPEWACAGVRH